MLKILSGDLNRLLCPYLRPYKQFALLFLLYLNLVALKPVLHEFSILVVEILALLPPSLVLARVALELVVPALSTPFTLAEEEFFNQNIYGNIFL